jgi:hypothetical protein
MHPTHSHPKSPPSWHGFSTRAFLLTTLLLTTTLATPPDDPITITASPPTTHTRTFDPKSPPPDIHLTHGEAALTRSSFTCSAAISATVLSRTEAGPNSSATIRVEELKITLTLDDTLFLPTNSTPKLTAHEQGHRHLTEIIYQSAADTARQLATPLIGQSFTSTGPSADAAADSASKSVIQKLCDSYMSTLPARSSAANNTYDHLTDHGRNTTPESTAIQKSLPTTQPTSSH